MVGVVMNIVSAERMPHVIMIRAIHTRAPTLCRMTLLGISKMK